MSAITYKCLNCPSNLRMDPETQDFVCDYCGSHFSLQDFHKRSVSIPAETCKPMMIATYHCQNCGAEINTDETTAASFCLYCHGPVILSNQLSGDHQPDKVIPFRMPREQVIGAMMRWCKKKRFIDTAFFDQAQVEKISGVYFPFYVASGEIEGFLNCQGKKVKTWASGHYRYTQTDTYQIEREGKVAFNDMTINALNKDHTYILNGILPYDQHKAVPFSMPYLSGFLADKRAVDENGVLPEITRIANQFTSAHLKKSAAGFSSVNRTTERISIKHVDYLYVLMPAWMLTYTYHKEQYYFAMNGDSGKIAGRVPLSRKKLLTLSIIITIIVFFSMIALGWFL